MKQTISRAVLVASILAASAWAVGCIQVQPPETGKDSDSDSKPAESGGSTGSSGGTTGGSASASGGGTAATGGVQVNGKPANATELARIEQQYNTKVAPGQYWYDGTSGLGGRWGGPAQVFAPGFDFGTVPRDASSGHSGILFNGRELTDVEVKTVLQLFKVDPSAASQYRGSYTLDQTGVLTDANGQFVGNITEAAQSAKKAASSSSDGFWTTKNGVSGNSGCGGYVSFPASSSSGNISTDLPGC